MRQALLIIMLLLGVGCTPRTIVRKNPGPEDTGVRYYRPKPYLLIQSKAVQEGPELRHDKYVQISLEYLPDFSEEYSISVRSGLGTNKTSIKLADGWNLTEINQDLDSQFDENVKAIGDLLEAVAPGGIVPTAQPKSTPTRMVVAATNVPLGYYEAVINRRPDGKKQLYGWRYVGFYPFQSCPIAVAGSECVDCQSPLIYGLVFRHGVMTFEPLQTVAIDGFAATRQIQLPPAEPASLPTPEPLNIPPVR